MNDDPPETIKEKLQEIHQDLQGGFKTVHDRLDREVTERAWSLERLWAALGALRNDIQSLFRRAP